MSKGCTGSEGAGGTLTIITGPDVVADVCPPLCLPVSPNNQVGGFGKALVSPQCGHCVSVGALGRRGTHTQKRQPPEGALYATVSSCLQLYCFSLSKNFLGVSGLCELYPLLQEGGEGHHPLGETLNEAPIEVGKSQEMLYPPLTLLGDRPFHHSLNLTEIHLETP